MAFGRSQALCKALLGSALRSVSAATLAINDNSASADTITSASAGGIFGSSAIVQYDRLLVQGASSTSNCVFAVATSVASSTLTFPTGTFASSESAGNTILLTAFNKASMRELFHNAYLDIYDGTRPDTPEDAENGNLLVRFTGIQFGAPTFDSANNRAYIQLYSTLSNVNATNSGTMAWARMRGGQTYTTGEDSTNALIRLDMSVGQSTGDLIVTNTSVTAGKPQNISNLEMRAKVLLTGV